MKDEIKVNKANKSITFINNGIAFSQFGIVDEILDLITNLQEEIEKQDYIINKQDKDIVALSNGNKDLKSRNKKAVEYIKNNCCYLVDNDDKNLLNILNGGDFNE